MYAKQWRGEHLIHERFCLGLDSTGRPLGVSLTNYPVNNVFTMENIIATFEKDLLPTTDWNASFGNVLSRGATLMSDRQIWPIAHKWESNRFCILWWSDSALVPRPRFDVNPHTIVSAIRALELESSCIKSTENLSAKQSQNCGVAVFRGSYGAGRGAVTAAAPFIRETASGQVATVLARSQLRGLSRLKQILSKLRIEGTVAVIVEIVSSSTGRLLTKEEWDNLAQACHAAGLYLVVDEAQTAGLRACGIAAYTDGVMTTTLGYTSETMSKVTYLLDSTFSEPINSYVLLQSWAIVRAAMNEDWPNRAARIGDNLRRILADMTPPEQTTSFMGMGTFILIERGHAATLWITGASAGKKTIRWLPPLDKSLASYEAVRALFGPAFAVFRDDLYQLLDEPATSCVNCGESLEGAEGKSWVRCPTCKGAFCSFCTEEGYEMAPVHERCECLSF
ncbi:hypothetical protein LZ31DRAFT_570815 [Colletotrichum somersetense]|nr:hypothetical protein LZ31DRAFT_570815 [Colletotrichum somersetense]